MLEVDFRFVHLLDWKKWAGFVDCQGWSGFKTCHKTSQQLLFFNIAVSKTVWVFCCTWEDAQPSLIEKHRKPISEHIISFTVSPAFFFFFGGTLCRSLPGLRSPWSCTTRFTLDDPVWASHRLAFEPSGTSSFVDWSGGLLGLSHQVDPTVRFLWDVGCRHQSWPEHNETTHVCLGYAAWEGESNRCSKSTIVAMPIDRFTVHNDY